MSPARPILPFLAAAAIAGYAMPALAAAPDATTARISLTADLWEANGKAEFVQEEGFPRGLLKLGDGSAVARDLTFADGTIEYDAKLLDDGFAAIRFRREGPDTSEIFYLRPDANCPAANDCIQYVPRVHGVWPWEMYPEYQASAPVSVGRWNHVRLVVSGRRMNVYVNGATSPTLAVGRLEGDALGGGLELAGPAEFANLAVTPGATDGLPPSAAADPTAHDPGLLRDWEVSTVRALPYGTPPDLAQRPADAAAWHRIAAERHGLVNLSRLYGSPTDKATTAIAWLRTSLRSDRAQTKRVSFGFLHQAWVYVNGRPVFSRENLYYPEAARLVPDGRLSLENSSFELPLREGDNEIVIALGNTVAAGHLHYGWGLELRLDDPAGVTLPTG